MGKPAKAAKSGKSGKSTKSDPIPKDWHARCMRNENFSWCAKLSFNVFSKMSKKDLVKFNCGVDIDVKCNQAVKDKWRKRCKQIFPEGNLPHIDECIQAKIVTSTITGCLHRKDGKSGKGGKKRAANLSGDASSSMAIWASVGVIIFLLICALIAWWYLKGDKKGAGRTAKGASKSGKSKMTTGKSKLGSRKSQVASRKSLAGKAASRKGSQRSKVSQASKGSAKKSRRSGKKK